MDLTEQTLPSNSKRMILRAVLWGLIPLVGLIFLLSLPLRPSHAAGGLSVEIVAGHNLVVDSNVSSPSTFGPSVATVMGRFCNTNPSGALTNVWAYIGDYDPNNDSNPADSTPGIYPVRTEGEPGWNHPLLDNGNPGTYSFTHLGGVLGTQDASRFIGTLNAGQCVVQYWHFTYPQCEYDTATGKPDTPPCNPGLDPVWGAANDPNDDLWLNFDIWATSDGGGADHQTWKMTMRNEISAMANKIEPNPNGRWFNTEGDVVYPGDIITSNGVRYELGNVNKGFDNDGDGIYDFNAWMQPVGSASYDPSCFRLIRTSGTLTVTRSGGNPDLIINFTDQLYFTKLPPDNTGVTGNVYYTFLALGGACTASLSPYQEVASGSDNEKFNADYGTGIPPIVTYSPAVTVTKNGPNLIAENTTYTYNIPFQNNSATSSAGLTLSTNGVNMPLTIQDTVPNGIKYVCGSASATLNFTPNSGVTIYYSSNSGATWNTSEPAACPGTNPTSLAPNNLIMIRWVLNDPLPNKTGATAPGGVATFQAQVPTGYSATSAPFVENCASASFLSGPSFAESCKTTLVQGSYSIGDFIWRDLDADGVQDGGAETGLGDISVYLYYDKDNDGILDSGEPLIQTAVSAANGSYSFTNLPRGNYLVVVDINDPDLPTGYNNTTPITLRVSDLGVGTPSPYNTADFGFGPTLKLDKVLVSASPVNEGSPVIYDIKLTNTMPPSSNGYCTYTTWATATGSLNGGNKAQRWNIASEPNALGAQGPDGLYAYTPWGSGEDRFSGTTFTFPNTPYGQITKVEALYLIYLQSTVSDDTASFHLYWNNLPVTGADLAFTPAQLNAYGPTSANQAYVTINWTANPPGGTWDWSDFSGDLELIIDADRTGGSDGATLYMDALGFRVTTDQPCGGASSDIAYLPLTDTYDPSKLQFVSADPSPDSTTPAGTLTWTNLGPLYGGQTKTVRVTFLALDPGATSAATNNTASVSGARFGSGRLVNDATDTEPVTVRRTARIGDTIWYNANGNSTQDPGEPGIPGVTVRLCTTAACTSVIATTTTDINGRYEFTVVDGTYYVVVTPPTGGTLNYDPDGGNNNYSQVTVAGTDNLSQDFGYNMSDAIVTGKVWEDNSGDALQQAGENGFSGVTVYLCSVATYPCPVGNRIATTTTNANGEYFFTSVPNGSYYIQVVTNTGGMAGYTWSQTLDPDGSPFSNIYPFTVNTAVSRSYGSYDFAFRRTPASSVIGDTIFVDWNGNGIQEAGEEGLANVTVYLYEDANGNGVIDPATDALIATQITNSSGTYLFQNVPAGNYIVLVDRNTIPDNYVQTKDPDQNGVCTLCDNKDPISVDGTSSYLNEDFGYQPTGTGTIGDRVWADLDGDGVQDSGENGIANITVRLYEDSNGNGIIDANDFLIATATTDSSGSYLFTNLADGRYLVQADASDPDLPKNALNQTYLPSTSNPYLAILDASDRTIDTADFGFMPPAAIGNYIWNDADADGTQDLTETGINGVIVQLYRDTNNDGIGDVLVATTTTANDPVTGASGYYVFNNLTPGDYVVVLPDSNFAPGGTLYNYAGTYDPDATDVPCLGSSASGCDHQSVIVDPGSGYGLKAGQIDFSNDFGFVYMPPGIIGDTLWVDADGNGVRDEYESGIANVTVELWNCSSQPCTLLTSTATNSSGYYQFTGVPAGSYEVRVLTSDPDLANYAPRYDPDGTLDQITTVVMDSNGQVTSVGGTPCPAGQICNLDADFGYQEVGNRQISGTVFFDAANDGNIYNAGTDIPIGGVPVYLYRCTDINCTSKTLFAITTTESSGAYNFASLPAGYYQVAVDSSAPSLQGMTITYERDEPGPEPDNYCSLGDNCNNRTTLDLTASLSASNVDWGFYAAIDYDDLPTIYGTLSGDEGAGHIVGTLYLGYNRSTETNGQPSATASLDNYDDGITRYGDWSVRGNTVSLSAYVTGVGGFLVGYFDWNADGDFNDPGEVITFGNTQPGSNLFYLTIPSDANTSSSLYARFRLYDGTTMQYASATGLAFNGEVEGYVFDYKPTAVTIVAFDGEQTVNRITLNWETALELDMVGYNVYRSEGPDGPKVKLNGDVIQAQLGWYGSTYTFEDVGVESGKTYYYWLEIVNLDGTEFYPEPVVITVWRYLYVPIVIR